MYILVQNCSASSILNDSILEDTRAHQQQRTPRTQSAKRATIAAPPSAAESTSKCVKRPAGAASAATGEEDEAESSLPAAAGAAVGADISSGPGALGALTTSRTANK